MDIMTLIFLLTLVHTEQGLKPIEEIRVGDKVLSLNEKTGETNYQPVMELMQHEGTYQLVKVTLENDEPVTRKADKARLFAPSSAAYGKWRMTLRLYALRGLRKTRLALPVKIPICTLMSTTTQSITLIHQDYS